MNVQGYRIQYVGLACFLRVAEGRDVLLPDGREPGNGIEPHYACIVVSNDDVRDAVGWDASELGSGRFLLPPCTVVFEGADDSGGLDTTAHDGRLPQLKQLEPSFAIERERAHATSKIRRGTLAAYRMPFGNAIISQLAVPHDGEITVTVNPRDGSPERSLRLREGTEIALTNTASDYLDRREADDHFRIYETLSANPNVRLREPQERPDIPRSTSTHVAFVRRRGLSIACSNTGCC